MFLSIPASLRTSPAGSAGTERGAGSVSKPLGQNAPLGMGRHRAAAVSHFPQLLSHQAAGSRDSGVGWAHTVQGGLCAAPGVPLPYRTGRGPATGVSARAEVGRRTANQGQGEVGGGGVGRTRLSAELPLQNPWPAHPADGPDLRTGDKMALAVLSSQETLQVTGTPGVVPNRARCRAGSCHRPSHLDQKARGPCVTDGRSQPPGWLYSEVGPQREELSQMRPEG